MNKIILSAYACHPNRGSECGVGWGWFNQLSKYYQVWVLFYAGQGQEEAIREAVFLLPQKDNIHLVPISVPKFFQERLYRIRYEIWQRRAYLYAKKLVVEQNIDIIHHVTLATWWNCGHLWKLNIPFIFGPISGFQMIPLKALSFLRFDGIINEVIRSLFVFVFSKFHLRFLRTIKKAKLIFAANEATYNYLAKGINRNKVKLLSEIGANSDDIVGNTFNDERDNAFTIIWSSHLIHLKNFGLVFESLRNLPENINWKLYVLGDGKLLDYWKKKVNKSRIKKKIVFKGRVALAEVKSFYNKADIFVFPSLREASGTVILEAMSAGLPTIALKLNGANILLDDKSGILIDIENKKQMIEDFRNAIIKLFENPILRKEMGGNAQERALRLFTWEARGKYMSKIYEKVLNTF